MKLILSCISNVVRFVSVIKNKSLLFLTGIYLSLFMNIAMADGGEDRLKDVAKDFFASFVGTGINALLLIEVIAAVYLFTTSRKIAALIGIPICLAITGWAKVRFGG